MDEALARVQTHLFDHFADPPPPVPSRIHLARPQHRPQLNDLWMYSPSLNRWSQVSSDGCMAGETGLIYQTSIEGIMTMLMLLSVLFSAALILCSHCRQKGSGTLCAHWIAPRTTREGGGTVGIQLNMVPPRTGYERIA